MIVDGERLKRDLEANAAFGALPDDNPGRGRTVHTGTPADREAREYFVERLHDAGLDVTVDRVGNIMGMWYPDGTTDVDAPVVAGSHLDSVPAGGIFDGPLGVYAALEAVRALKESGRSPDAPLGVVSFTEEEGARFGTLLGSAVAAGKRTAADAHETTDTNGVSLAAALDEIGYLGTGSLDAAQWRGWMEVHIEQGPRLETAGTPAGVVAAITGISQLEVTFEGEANHAGTTVMGDRADTLAVAAELILAVEAKAQALREDSESVVGTVGQINASPNATNVIPGRTTVGVDIRDVTRETMDALQAHVTTELDTITARRSVAASQSSLVDIDPTPLAEDCIGAITAAAETTETDVLKLHSGAGHDSMHIADVTPAGMIFAPSAGGISHNPREHTDWADCTTVTNLLAATLLELA